MKIAEYWAQDTESKDGILNRCLHYGLLPAQTAYVFATAWHETGGRMEPVREGFGRSDAESYVLVTNMIRKRGMRNYAAIARNTGQSYYGRGYVQLTFQANYRKAGARLGLPLERNPELALDHDVAAEILVRGMKEGWFRRTKLSDHINESQVDFIQARDIVNGRLDRAHIIEGYARAFLELVTEALD